jgi:hypothetical protein
VATGGEAARVARGDVIAVLIGAEVGAALGLLLFGSVPLLPIFVTLVGAAWGPVVLRGWRPVRLVLFQRWLRTRLREGALPPTT